MASDRDMRDDETLGQWIRRTSQAEETIAALTVERDDLVHVRGLLRDNVAALTEERDALKAELAEMTVIGTARTLDLERERDEAIRERDAALRQRAVAVETAQRVLGERDEARQDVATLLEAIAAELTHGGIRDRIAQATAILGAETEKGSRARPAAERLDADREAFYERMTAAVERTGYTGGQGDGRAERLKGRLTAEQRKETTDFLRGYTGGQDDG